MKKFTSRRMINFKLYISHLVGSMPASSLILFDNPYQIKESGRVEPKNRPHICQSPLACAAIRL